MCYTASFTMRKTNRNATLISIPTTATAIITMVLAVDRVHSRRIYFFSQVVSAIRSTSIQIGRPLC